MMHLKLACLSPFYVILGLLVTRSDGKDEVKCYNSINDVEVHLKCKDGNKVISIISQFTYSRHDGRECEEDWKEGKCTFNVTDKQTLRTSCLNRRSCYVRIHPGYTGPTFRVQRGQHNECSPDFRGRVIVHLRYRCKGIKREYDHSTEKTELTARPPTHSTTTQRRTSPAQPTTTTRQEAATKTHEYRTTLPVAVGGTATYVVQRTNLDGNVGQQSSTNSAQEAASNTGLIVGSGVGVLVLCLGVVTAFILVRRRDKDVKMSPATISTGMTGSSYDGPYITSNYAADHIYEEAPTTSDLPESQPRIPPGEIRPPVPSRTPSNESTASRTPSNDVVPPQSPSTNEQHQYLELISDNMDPVAPQEQP